MSLLEGLCNALEQSHSRPTREQEREVPRRVVVRHAPAPTPIGPGDLPDGYLSSILDREDAIPERSRLGRGNFIHASSLVDLCPRQYYLAHEHGTEDYGDHLGRRLTGGHRVTFALGHAAEAHVRKQLLAHMRDRVYGLWKCRCGRTSGLGMFREDRMCLHCNFHIDRYHEPVLRNEEYSIIGRPDITIVDNNRHLIVVEIKSMALARWQGLTRPPADHILQALLYWWLYREQGRQVHHKIVFIYVGKEFLWGSPYKEFHIDANDEAQQSMLRTALGIAMHIVQARANGQIPERTLCSDVECGRARNCPVRALCFNMD